MKRIFAASLVIVTAVLNAPVGAQSVEEIYLARSLRLERGAPSGFCDTAKTGFKAEYEDAYEFRAPVVASGRITDTMGTKAGSGRGCLGPVTNEAVADFYLDLQLGEIALHGRGDCRRGKMNFPEPGLTTFRCYVQLSDPTGHYAGGLLTTNTMSSRNVLGAVSDPPGYAQPSIATIRLWRKTSTKE